MEQIIESQSITVYTALYGDYESLVEQPIAASSSARFVCFTDNRDMKSDTWEVRYLAPPIPGDSVRSARKVKILGYQQLNAGTSIWIDNRVILKSRPEELVDAFLADAPVAMPTHDHRASVFEEFREVAAAGLDVPWRVREQLHNIRSQAPKVLDQPPLWTAILLRRDTPAVAAAMQLWWDHVALFSRRDQLSVNFAIHATGLRVRSIHIPNGESDIHVWLRADRLPKRNDVLYGRAFNYSLAAHVRDAALRGSLGVRLRNKLQRVRWAWRARRR